MSNDTKATKLKSIEIEPLAGSHIDDCLRDAIILSVMSKCEVIFIHNCTRYSISYFDLMDCNSKEQL